jgi:sugar/nucleoside kinase (ribokinase family)
MKDNASRLNIENYSYEAVIGTGGIGSGIFLALKGDQTLGREESRAVRILDQRDYCKLHIIFHYVKTLLTEGYPVIPVGKVGNDAAGVQLLQEMQAAGLDLRFVEICQDLNTTFSYSFLYPNGEGGNLTVDNAASSRVDPATIRRIKPEFALYREKCIALAVPEVPIEARSEFLNLASFYQCFRVTSFLSGEIKMAIELGMMEQIDLLSINLEEAATMIDLVGDSSSGSDILQRALDKLLSLNPKMLVAVTGGKNGSWSWDGRKLFHLPAIETRVVNAAGAGDAFLAGLIISLIAGLELSQAQEFANLLAAMSVNSRHTIHPAITRISLSDFAAQHNLQLSRPIRTMIS